MTYFDNTTTTTTTTITITASTDGTSPPWRRGQMPSSDRSANSGFSSPWDRTPTHRPVTSSASVSRPWGSRSGQSNNWRVNAGPPKGPPPSPPKPECVPGLVVLLPEEHEVPVTSCFHKEAEGMGQPWNHPVVVTKVWRNENGVQLAKVRGCTSRGGQGIVGKKEYHHHYYVAADHKSLASGSFNKDTYVNCSPGHALTIECEHLQVWSGKPVQFQKWAVDSFDQNEPRSPRRDSGLGFSL